MRMVDVFTLIVIIFAIAVVVVSISSYIFHAFAFAFAEKMIVVLPQTIIPTQEQLDNFKCPIEGEIALPPFYVCAKKLNELTDDNLNETDELEDEKLHAKESKIWEGK